MQASHSEEVKRPGLLKRLFDIFRRLVPDPEHDSAQEILHVRRVVQAATNRVLHPFARFLRRAQNRVSTAMSNECTVFWIADKQGSTNVATREIRPHVEFAWISRRCDQSRDSEKPQLIGIFRGAAPADEPGRTCSLVPAFEFDGLKPQQERRKSVRRDFGLADDDSSRSDYSWSITKLNSKLLAFGVACL